MILSLFINGQRCAEPARLNLHGLTGAEAPGIVMILQRVHASIKHNGLQFTSRDDGLLVECFAGLLYPVVRGNAVKHPDSGCGLTGAAHI